MRNNELSPQCMPALSILHYFLVPLGCKMSPRKSSSGPRLRLLYTSKKKVATNKKSKNLIVSSFCSDDVSSVELPRFNTQVPKNLVDLMPHILQKFIAFILCNCVALLFCNLHLRFPLVFQHRGASDIIGRKFFPISLFHY